MKAAIVRDFNRSPEFGNTDEPQVAQDELLIRVRAAALSQLARAHAAGKHYSSPKSVPFVAGIDGVGELADGTVVYFAFARAPYGAMAERTVVPRGHCIPIPNHTNLLNAAGAANPGMSSWAALTRRAEIRSGEAVLINGATGISGRLAVKVARHLGASRIVATGRNAETILSLTDLGADHTIPLDGIPEETVRRLRAAIEDHDIRVVLDYLWGEPAKRILEAIARRDPNAEQPRIRFVQIGSSAGKEMQIDSHILRSTAVELMGSGIGSIPFRELILACGEFLSVAESKEFSVPTLACPLAEIGEAWNASDRQGRIVFTV
jgi:NADPH:quinone reductase-like Zn-dependent oxidoreductase